RRGSSTPSHSREGPGEGTSYPLPLVGGGRGRVFLPPPTRGRGQGEGSSHPLLWGEGGSPQASPVRGFWYEWRHWGVCAAPTWILTRSRVGRHRCSMHRHCHI